MSSLFTIISIARYIPRALFLIVCIIVIPSFIRSEKQLPHTIPPPFYFIVQYLQYQHNIWTKLYITSIKTKILFTIGGNISVLSINAFIFLHILIIFREKNSSKFCTFSFLLENLPLLGNS